MNEIELFFMIHKDLPREGPGDDGSTRKAFSMVDHLPDQARVLDMGCGPGAQTLELARLITHNNQDLVCGVDTHRPFLRNLASKAQKEGLAERIIPVQMSMFAACFPNSSFDLVWSEGAIYIIGFEEGLREWKRLLRPGGSIAVTEISWLKPDPPEEIRTYWETEYPRMGSIETNLERIQRQGYQLSGYFVLPPASWWNYYDPLEERIAHLRRETVGNETAQRLFDLSQGEIDLYRKYQDWYSYVFYVAKSA